MTKDQRPKTKDFVCLLGSLVFSLQSSVFVPVAQACPMCSDLVERGKGAFETLKFGQGIGWSILLMLAVPFTMLAAAVFVITRGAKRQTAEISVEKKAK